MTTQQNPPKSPTQRVREPASGKLGQIIRLLQRAKGATIDDLTEATGWQAHSVRGAISGQLRKRHGLAVSATKDASRGLVYRLPKAGGTR